MNFVNFDLALERFFFISIAFAIAIGIVEAVIMYSTNKLGT